MKKELLDFAPKRKDAIVRQLSDEFLVYDKETNRAHCLNRAAADVWKLCDGKKSVAEIVRTMKKESKSPVDEKLIWTALCRLQQSGLLLKRNLSGREEILLSRRALVRKMGVAAAFALPVVTSILVPTAAEAASPLQPRRHPPVVTNSSPAPKGTNSAVQTSALPDFV